MSNLQRVKCILWNAQSINNKILSFLQILEDNSIDLCFLTETWLKTQNNHITALLKEAGYKITHLVRSIKQGGGVAIISRQNYECKFEKLLEFNSFECIIQSFKIENNPINITIVLIYRPDHHSENISTFLDEFYNLTEYIQLNFKHFIICGDLNIHVNKVADPTTVKFADILNTFSLLQTVNGPTQKCGNTLDLIMHDPLFVNICNVKVDDIDRISDHFMIYFDINRQIKSLEKKKIYYRNLKEVVLADFHTDLINDSSTFLQNADCNSFSSSLDLFKNIFKDRINTHAPLITKTIQNTNRPPWMDTEFLHARSKRRKLYKRWKRTGSDEHREEFVQQRWYVNELSKEKRRTFFQNAISCSANSQKELSKLANNLLDRDKKSVLPYTENPLQLTNKFNNFFIQKIENIRNNFNNSNVSFAEGSMINNSNISTLCSFKCVSAADIKKQIQSSKIKTCPRDPIPAFLLESSIEYIIPSLVHLVNTSLSTGSMDGLKESVVTPILKKPGLDPDILSNYRPVCSGLYVDKLIQSNVLLQLNEHMTKNSLHISQQSGYKSNHSCETVLLRILNDVLILLDSKRCAILLLLDLSAAFDTVDHHRLLYILKHEIGLGGTVLKWFASFLSDRIQSTNISGSNSETRGMPYGVPQGSVVGPVLFNIYVRNFISMLEKAGFIVHGYADDHQVLYTFRIEFQYEAICHSLPKGLHLITQWMTSHFLKLNAGKSQLLIFTPKNLRDQLCIDRVYLGSNMFIPVSLDAINLGVKLDSQVTFSPHISMVIAQSYQQISNIGQIRKYLTVENLRTLVQSLIVSKIDNCNSLLYGVAEYEISRLQKLQNSCARLIYSKKRNESVSELLFDLHWLPIKQRIYFKILLFVFKFFKHKTPNYINQCLHISDLASYTLQIPRTKTPYGDRAFANCAPKLWNALPPNIKHMATIESFKKHLKHYLFTNFRSFRCEIDKYLT